MEKLRYIHLNKTAKMFAAAAGLGAIAGGAEDNRLEALLEYGLKIGLCFQVADDLLDVSASSEQLGKTAGKDVKKGKLTYPAFVGMERSREISRELTSQAVGALGSFGPEAQLLRMLAGELAERQK
jgi:geranylgeranyl diphosphate synthase type II